MFFSFHLESHLGYVIDKVRKYENMDSVILTVNERGQMTIPKKFRDILQITVQTPLIVSLNDDKILIEVYGKNKPRQKYSYSST